MEDVGDKIVNNKIGFIGAGKVGCSLGKYFAEKGLNVIGYYSRTKKHSDEAATLTGGKSYNDLEELVSESTLIFVTVPDTSISIVWDEIKDFDIKGKIICHCSGSMTSEIFKGAESGGATCYSVHPLYAINDKAISYKDLTEAYFTIEGSGEHIESIRNMILGLGNKAEIIDRDVKMKYHAAAVMLSNLMISLANAGKNIFSECGLSEDFAANAWKELFLGNAENICKKGLIDSLTGPIERNDLETVISHIEILNGNERDIYVALSRTLVEVAALKNPDRDYSKLKKELRRE